MGGSFRSAIDHDINDGCVVWSMYLLLEMQRKEMESLAESYVNNNNNILKILTSLIGKKIIIYYKIMGRNFIFIIYSYHKKYYYYLFNIPSWDMRTCCPCHVWRGERDGPASSTMVSTYIAFLWSTAPILYHIHLTSGSELDRKIAEICPKSV